MASTSGSAAEGGGRVARKRASPRGRSRSGRSRADGAEDTTTGPPGTPSDEGQATGSHPASSSGEAGDGTRSGLDALAARRVPRAIPPAPGGVLPTTRRGMLRYRVLPRSVVGISMLILAFAIGAGFSGVVLFSYYQYKQNQADSKVNALISGYKGQFAKAESDLNAAVQAARANIATQLKGAQSQQVGPAKLASIIKQISPSVYFVHTLDASGQPSVGTAFVISSNAQQSLLLTSYTTVAAATHAPGPAIAVSQGDSSSQTPVTVRTWDQQYDLALLILPKGGLTPVTAAPASPSPQPGDRLFAVSGLGSAGASVAQGLVVDVSSSGLELDAPIGTPFQGGPIVNDAGQVVAVGSRSYAPLGFSSQGTFFVPYVEAACNKVLSCPGGTLVGSH
jgi:S1-C subfamily serine protease